MGIPEDKANGILREYIISYNKKGDPSSEKNVTFIYKEGKLEKTSSRRRRRSVEPNLFANDIKTEEGNRIYEVKVAGKTTEVGQFSEKVEVLVALPGMFFKTKSVTSPQNSIIQLFTKWK